MFDFLFKKISGNTDFLFFTKGVFYGISFNVLGRILVFIFTIYIAQYFGATVIGDYYTCISLLTWFAIFNSFGFGQVIHKTIPPLKEKGNTIQVKKVYQSMFSIVLIASSVLFLVFYLTAGYIGVELLDSLSIIPFLKWAAISLPFVVITQLNVEFLRAFEKTMMSEFLKWTSNPIVQFSSILILMVLYPVPQALIISFFISNTLIAIVSSLFLSNKFKFFSKFQFATSNILKPIFQVSLPLMLGSFSIYLFKNSDGLMIYKILGAKEAGVYNIAYLLSFLLVLVPQLINVIGLPKLSGLYNTGKIKRYYYSIRFISILYASIIPFIILLMLFGQYLLVLFGMEFISGITTLRILCLAGIIIALTGPAIPILIIHGKQNQYFLVTAFSAGINIVLNYWLILRYGMEGAAMATTATTLLYCVLFTLIIISIREPIPSIFGVFIKKDD